MTDSMSLSLSLSPRGRGLYEGSECASFRAWLGFGAPARKWQAPTVRTRALTVSISVRLGIGISLLLCWSPFIVRRCLADNIWPISCGSRTRSQRKRRACLGRTNLLPTAKWYMFNDMCPYLLFEMLTKCWRLVISSVGNNNEINLDLC